jgi:hypothetical protein
MVLAAALLHDTLEDTETTLVELGAAFGDEIAAIVAEVSDDKTLEKAERKRRQIAHAPALSPRALPCRLPVLGGLAAGGRVWVLVTTVVFYAGLRRYESGSALNVNI